MQPKKGQGKAEAAKDVDGDQSAEEDHISMRDLNRRSGESFD
jgi:hypothetical protein